MAGVAVTVPRPRPRLKPPVEGAMTCLNCGPHATLLPLDAFLHPGFGAWEVSCSDGRVKVYPENGAEDARLRAVDEFAAALDPECEKNWLLRIDGPLWGGTYQRHAQGHLALVEQNDGFA